MSLVKIDPVFWSINELHRCGESVVHEMAQVATGTRTAYQYLLGRCLVAMKLDHWYENYGCSSVIHYATSRLGVAKKEALRYYNVALNLSRLPKLSGAAMAGRIEWGKLREISRVASEETEELWIELAKKHTYHEIERLTARTPKDEWPKLGDDEESELARTLIRCYFNPGTMEMLDSVQRKLSQEAGRPLSATEVFEQLCAERIAKGLPDDTLAKSVERRVKLRRAHRRNGDAKLIEQARAVADDLGLQEPSRETDEPARVEENPGGLTSAIDRRLASDEEPAGDEASLQAEPLGTARVEIAARPLNESYEVKLTACPGACDLNLAARVNDGPEDSRIRFSPKTRLATPPQREELLRRDEYRCCVPGCPHHLWLEAHHLLGFAAGGATDWPNLRMICSACHRNIHSGLLVITRLPDGSLRFADKQGRNLRRDHDLAVAGWLNYWQGWLGDENDSHSHRAAGGHWPLPECEMTTIGSG